MGMFAGQDENPTFTAYRVRAQFRQWLAGGIPRNSKMIEQWIRVNAGATTNAEERLLMLTRTLRELGVDIEDGATPEQLIAASQHLADLNSTQGFKSDENGLYIEGRQVKAMWKECTNILFGKTCTMGPTKKGPKNFVAEHVHVEPDRIYLDRTEADEIQLFIGHINGKGGPTSTLTYTEVVLQPKIEFMVLFTQSAHKEFFDGNYGRLGGLWNLAEQNGLGAMRAQGFGKFDVTEFEVMEAVPDFAVESSNQRVVLIRELEEAAA